MHRPFNYISKSQVIFNDFCQKYDLGLNFLSIETYSLTPKGLSLYFWAKWFTYERLSDLFGFIFHLDVSKFRLKDAVLSNFLQICLVPYFLCKRQ